MFAQNFSAKRRWLAAWITSQAGVESNEVSMVSKCGDEKADSN